MNPDNRIEDLDTHQKLMDALMTATDTCNDAVTKAIELLEAVETHNQDSTAHPDLRKEIEDSGGSSIDSIDERLAQHNASPTAHPELVAKLQAAMADLSKIRPLIDEVVATHSSNPSAHGDIRTAINEIRTQIRDIDLPQVSKDLEAVKQAIEADIKSAITKLQSVDAKHDSLILKNKSDLEKLQETVNQLELDVIAFSSGNFLRQEALDRLELGIHANDTGEQLGYSQHNANGPVLLDFDTTLPTYLGNNLTFDFTMKGAKHNSNPISYTIELGRGDLQVSPLTGITDNKKITVVTGNNGHPGDIAYMVVTATDTTTKQSVKRIINAMYARPIELANLSLHGLKRNVEPGQAYKFKVRNLLDDGTGRFSYKIEALESGLIFSKQTNIRIGEDITMTVPASAERNTTVKFKIILIDKYCGEQSREEEIHINAIPGVTDFHHTVPLTGVPGQTYQIKFWGIVSADGTPCTYRIENENTELTFGKKDSILANENVAMTLDKAATRGKEYKWKLVAVSVEGSTTEIELGTRINVLPDSATVTTTLPKEAKGAQQVNFKISGGADSDGDDKVTYDIESEDKGEVFTKTKNVLPTDTIGVTFAKVAKATPKTIRIWVVDKNGERSATYKEATITINPIYVAVKPYIISPQEGNQVNADFTMTWSPFEMTVDTK